jgi:sirohydrochlorin ferrochelatase
MTGYIVFAHGSSVESANEAVRTVAREAARRGAWDLYAAAFLGGGRPNLAEAVDQLVQQGAGRMVVIPYFLTLGLHLERDLPALVEEIRRSRPGIEIDVAPPLDGHAALVDALVDRAKESVCRAR